MLTTKEILKIKKIKYNNNHKNKTQQPTKRHCTSLKIFSNKNISKENREMAIRSGGSKVMTQEHYYFYMSTYPGVKKK